MKAEQIFQRALDLDLEIVSYGLAPNPNGFCFEIHEPRVARDAKEHSEAIMRFNRDLDALSKIEIEKLRALVFGNY